MGNLWQDVRYGIRMLVKNPGFTAIAAITLALGIGANTAIFTVINSVLLSSLPVKDPQQLVVLSDPDAHGMSRGSEDGDRDLIPYPEVQDFRDRNKVFAGVLAADSNTATLAVAVENSGPVSEGSPASIALVSGTYFPVLGVDAIIGRTFTADVDRVRDANPVAVISYAFWQSRFAGDRSVIDRHLRIRQTSYEVIGVAPSSFFGETVGNSPD